MNTKGLNESGTVERESMEIEEIIQALQQWHRVAGYSERTLQADRQRLNPFWVFLEKRGVVQGERVELAAVTASIIADYQNYLFEYVAERSGQKLTAYSQTNYLHGVRTLFGFLHKTQRLGHDPSRIIRLPRASVSVPSAILSPEEVRRLLLAPNSRTVLGFRDRCLLEVLWSTGLRINELITLNVEDARLDQGELLVSQGKGHKQRLLPLGAGAVAWLRQYLAQVRPVLTREAWRGNTGWRPTVSCPRLFLSQSGQQMDASCFGKKLRYYQRKARINKRITGHVFRHSLATEMLKAGADLRHIQEMLGHARLTNTQRYLQVVKEELKKVHRQSHPREQMQSAPVQFKGWQ